MVHSGRKTSGSALPRAMQSQSGKGRRNGKTVSATNEENSTHEKSTPGSFFTKRTAMLFFVAAYIFLKHQDDFARQNAAATLQEEVHEVEYPEEEFEDEEAIEGEEEEKEESYKDDQDYQIPVQQNMPIRIPKDELVDESIPVFDIQYKDLLKVKVEGGNAVYPLKPEDLSTEVSKFTDWNGFKQSLEHDWEKLKVKLYDSRKQVMREKNDKWAGSIRLIENKWSEYGKLLTEGQYGSFRKYWRSDENWEEWFEREVKSEIDSKLQKWLDDTKFNLFQILLKDVEQFKELKIKGWLAYQWKMNERDTDYKSFGLMTTSKFLNLAQSRGWYHANPNIDKQRRELMLWFFHKENEYLGYEWQKWDEWKNEKIQAVKLLCEKFSGGCLDEIEWNGFVNQIVF
ncbi:Uncharacterized protein PCOAH_00048100 [Plasmodium coatneyi]|uniref:Tryptophan/threonine-rich plasmodium antigen C-terminal domain-containing protein n=1 Tax=Plasmodium coatneyi TaxID=208452 RepID=A0A1B1E663_9APIC|nr:Uncharacterized protein PCOAH_00048100 [Plasmodium coatneyi]ANQ10501.1 Uncharacterized protein PCOAH_00048100 [Plasmodium coatneyi]